MATARTPVGVAKGCDSLSLNGNPLPGIPADDALVFVNGLGPGSPGSAVQDAVPAEGR